MKKIIYEYVITLKKAKKELLKFYGIKQDLGWREIRKQVPFSASLDENLSYRFHGAGCKLLINEIICDFDYAPVNEFPIKFEIWKIIQFIKTHHKFKEQNYSESFILSQLNELIRAGILEKLRIGDYIQDVYQIKNEYYENPEKLSSS